MALGGIVQVIVFPDKATVWVLVLVYDEKKALVDPTAVKIYITDPDSTLQVDGEAMTQYESTTGMYEYFYHQGESSDPMAEGQWKGEVVVTDGTGGTAVISSSKFAFEVK